MTCQRSLTSGRNLTRCGGSSISAKQRARQAKAVNGARRQRSEIQLPCFNRAATGTDTRGLLRKDLPITRQMLRKLATKPILAEALPDGNGKGVYRFTFKGSYASLLPPVVVPTYMVSPTGFEPVLQP